MTSTSVGDADTKDLTGNCRDPECDHTVVFTVPVGFQPNNHDGVRVRCSACGRTNWIPTRTPEPGVLA